MHKRQKIVLYMLQKTPKPRNPLKIMKLVFLLKRETGVGSENSFYDFFPYNYGAYSLTLQRDLSELRRTGYLNGEGISINEKLIDQCVEVTASIDLGTRKSIEQIVERYGCLTTDGLLHYVYYSYPAMAAKSRISWAPQVKIPNKVAVFTAGYEGESLDHFLNKLVASGIKRLIDVRYNPLSRKYGFSKGTLSNWCGKIDIEYVHYRALGIPPEYRRELSSFEDYQDLLAEYETSILPNAAAAKDEVADLIAEKPSALFCFEADIRCCHRGRLAESISADSGLEVVHL
jgi:uncharacterized protein (DUF488 family)